MSVLSVLAAYAIVQTTKAEYMEGSTKLEGFMASPSDKSGLKPGVIIIHDWNGLDAYEEGRAKQIAGLGYYGLAADIYGAGVRPKNAQESGAEARKYYADPALFRRRLMAAFDKLKSTKGVDPNRIAIMGYCFGGAGALELARSGAPLAGAVSFHGGLSTTMPAKEGDVKCRILVNHAAGDPAVNREQLGTFLDEMKTAKVDYQMIVYNINAHAFTVPGTSYDEKGDKRSWAAMKSFFEEVFAK